MNMNTKAVKVDKTDKEFLLIQGGRFIDPKSGRDEIADILIADGRIVQIVPAQSDNPDSSQWANLGGDNEPQLHSEFDLLSDSTRVINARGKVVAPGLVDIHVHFREPGQTHKEDTQTGAAAAAAGGFTTVVCMANTSPPVDCAEVLREVVARAGQAKIEVLPGAALSKGLKGLELTDFAELKMTGAVGLTDDGLPFMDARLLKQAMEAAKALNLPISLHEEDPAFITGPGVNLGAVSEALNYGGASALAEELMIARDCLLALETGARVLIQHISSGVSVDIIRFFKSLGADIWAEVTPHHFSSTQDLVLKKGTLAKVNPPLRTEGDRQKLIEGLKDGTIDLISTDHAPHSSDEKARPLETAPSGMIGLETALALGLTNLVKAGHLTLTELLGKMTTAPSDFYGLDAGALHPGARANLVIFDPEEAWKVETFNSKSSNSPFIGETLYGRVHYTVYNGNIVYELYPAL